MRDGIAYSKAPCCLVPTSLAKAEKACAKVRTPVSWAAARPIIATAPRGMGVVMMPQIVERKTANRCQAWLDTPAGAGDTHRAAPMATQMPSFLRSAPHLMPATGVAWLPRRYCSGRECAAAATQGQPCRAKKNHISAHRLLVQQGWPRPALSHSCHVAAALAGRGGGSGPRAAQSAAWRTWSQPRTPGAPISSAEPRPAAPSAPECSGNSSWRRGCVRCLCSATC